MKKVALGAGKTGIDSTMMSAMLNSSKTELKEKKSEKVIFDDAAFRIPCEGFSLAISQHQILHTLDQQKLIFQEGPTVAKELMLWARRMVPSALCSSHWEILWVATTKCENITPHNIKTVFAPGGHPLNAMWYKPELQERVKGAKTLQVESSHGSTANSHIQSIMSSSSGASDPR